MTAVARAVESSAATTDPSITAQAPGSLRLARADDASAIERLIVRSVHGLQARDYSTAQREAALGYVFGVDHQLIADGTYFVVEAADDLIACGGWSRRRTLFGAQTHAVRDDTPLVPGVDAAKIRAFFVDPLCARRGLGARLLHACEAAARSYGFLDFELGATLTGVPLYRRYGYVAVERYDTPIDGAPALAIVRMVKRKPPPEAPPADEAPVRVVG